MLGTAMRPSRLPAVVLAVALLVAGGCGGDDDDKGKDAGERKVSCPAAAPGGFSGPTSEDLCVSFALRGSKVSSFNLQVRTKCSLGFGEPRAVLRGDPETITTGNAATNPGQPFTGTVTFEKPIAVAGGGSFEAGGLSGSVTGGEAKGSYELNFSGALLEEFTCTGGPVTWTATRDG
jgi:hypothetical protein